MKAARFDLHYFALVSHENALVFSQSEARDFFMYIIKTRIQVDPVLLLKSKKFLTIQTYIDINIRKYILLLFLTPITRNYINRELNNNSTSGIMRDVYVCYLSSYKKDLVVNCMRFFTR